MDHLSRRALERKIGMQQLVELATWLDSNPIAPQGKWYKRFDSFILCGEGELVKTVLTPGQVPTGSELK
jgi:hypothetical protein